MSKAGSIVVSGEVVAEDRVAAFLASTGEELVPPAREFLIRAGLANRSLDSSR
jgi:hypothetical protein